MVGLQQNERPAGRERAFHSKTKVHRMGPDLRVFRLPAFETTGKGVAAQAPRSTGESMCTSEDGTCPHGISDPAWCAFCKAGHGLSKLAAGVAEG